MATALANSIEQLKQEFCRSHAHLPEQQIRQLWFQAMSELPSSGSNDTHPSLVQQTPRSMSYSSTNMTQLPSSFGSMDRVQSAPATSTMIRSPSTSSANNNLQRCNSNVSNWQPSCDEQPNAYAVYSESASMRSQSSLQPIAETSALTNNSMVEYTPDEYITSCIEPAGSSPLPLSQTQNPRQLHVQLTPNAQWSPSLDDSTSPSTPSTALMTPVTQSSNSMSRQSSYNPQFHDEVSMLRIQSDSSSLFPILSEDGTISFPLDVESKNISSSVDNSHFLSQFTGNPSENFLSHVPVFSASVPALASSENEPCLVEDMRRSASSSSESDASSASAASISSRQQRRDREINAQAGRCKIAPKAIPCNSETKPASSNVQMTRIRSEDGSSKNVGVISRAPYVRPQHPKIMCPHCSERPEGFRGTHELDRHVARAHTKVRKGFICIDASNNKRFLANCKHCRNKKVYGAYYNAAAHLRRAHFHPRKRGRKGKHDEKRGGIGGGDDPPMDYLKQNWIKEVEIENKLAASSPDSGSDSAEPDVNNNFDTTYDVEMTYQPVASTTSDVPMSIPIDPNQYIDYSMCMNESDTLYSHQMMYATNEALATTSDINDFQFDAYRTQ